MVETGAACPHTSSERAQSGLDAHERRQRPEEAAEVGVVGLRGLGLRLRRRALERLGPLPREGLLRGFIFSSLHLGELVLRQLTGLLVLGGLLLAVGVVLLVVGFEGHGFWRSSCGPAGGWGRV